MSRIVGLCKFSFAFNQLAHHTSMIWTIRASCCTSELCFFSPGSCRISYHISIFKPKCKAFPFNSLYFTPTACFDLPLRRCHRRDRLSVVPCYIRSQLKFTLNDFREIIYRLFVNVTVIVTQIRSWGYPIWYWRHRRLFVTDEHQTIRYTWVACWII